MNDAKEKKLNVDKLFEEYRKSGLGLMTTVIGLSSGAFIGLFKYSPFREQSFLYSIPIAFALIQQLANYLGNQKKAISSLHWFISTHANDADKGMDAYVNAKTDSEKAKFLYDVSDKFCFYSCLSIVLVTSYFLFFFASLFIAAIIYIVLSFFLIFWFIKWLRLKRKLQRTDWFNY